jgi:hypothetical protein
MTRSIFPGFTAEASLYKSGANYQPIGVSGTPIAETLFVGRVYPQLPKTIGGESFTCDGLVCTCSGLADCNDMWLSNVCGQIGQCEGDSCFCFRL